MKPIRSVDYHLFISPLFDGSTSLMRLNAMKSILPYSCIIDTIDTQQIIDHHSRFSRSLSYKYKLGPVSWAINKKIKNKVEHKSYDIIWVEKGVLIKPSVVRMLKSISNTLIHFTPDPAFLFHKSNKFLNSIHYYDFLVTTKSFELNYYYRYKSPENVILVTQGFSLELHKSIIPFKKRKSSVIFIGHYEKNRSKTLQFLINSKIKIVLCGRGWKKFKEKNHNSHYFEFLGEKLFGNQYVCALNQYKFSIGFLSEWIPERHTTRSFEIPACGCLLLSPENQEIKSFYAKDEAIFYSDDEDLKNKLKKIFKNTELAVQIARKGHQRTISSDNSHSKIMVEILEKVLNL